MKSQYDNQKVKAVSIMTMKRTSDDKSTANRHEKKYNIRYITVQL